MVRVSLHSSARPGIARSVYCQRIWLQTPGLQQEDERPLELSREVMALISICPSCHFNP